MKKNWEKALQITLLLVGTYGERCFILLHTFICSMSPEGFSFLCLFIVFVKLVNMTSDRH